MNFLEFLRDTLINAGVSSQVYIDFLPNQPDNVILIKSSPGMSPDRGHNYDSPGFQIISRAKTHNTARSEIFKVFKALHDAPGMSATDVVDIYAEHSPYLAGEDDLGRYIYVQNYQSEIVRE